ncbi:hypothetical protein AGOR_G00098290 [Albula goreensis]|uniref:Uncharacterized protein n=1 Tax=Albula goreensis TaxID=1534307 RepID=A0A8T3DR83_9TELE|nr:hypothetical protein AGOR_G00098290 [Albula goreensis]
MEMQQMDILATLTEILECSICTETFKEPVTSPCGQHNYCMGCLTPQVKRCPVCREGFRKDFKPQKNVTLNKIVDVVKNQSSTGNLICHDYKNLRVALQNPELCDESSHNVQTLKRKLEHVISEIKALDDFLLNELKKKKQNKDNEIIPHVLQCTFSEIPPQTFVNITGGLEVGLECLNSALCQLQQIGDCSPVVDMGQNMLDILNGDQSPAEHSTGALLQHDADSMSALPVTAPLQAEGETSQLHSEAQSAAMELASEADVAGPSAALTDYLETLSFSPELGHRNLAFSPDNREILVRRRMLGWSPPSRPSRFDLSQVMAEQEFREGVHYWEVNTTKCEGWAIGVAYSTLGRGEQLGRAEGSWCLEWTAHSELSVWHNGHSDQLKHDCPSKVRVMLDMDSGSLAFYSISHHLILLYSMQIQFVSPVRPVFWLYGLKPGSLSFN